MLGTQDIMIALVLGLIFFGGKKLPELARGLGESLKEFKKATTHPDEPPTPSPSAPVAATAPRACPTCLTALQPDWTHCPKCGRSPASAS